MILYMQLLNEPIQTLKNWDYHSAENSVATTLAIEWGEKLSATLRRIYIDEGWDDQVSLTKKFAATASAEELLTTFADCDQ